MTFDNIAATIEQLTRKRFFLAVVCIVFVVLKIPALSYPFYWDEAWSYAPAIKEMYQRGPGLLPSALPPEISRGHPLLFYFLASGWMKIFGTSLVAEHSFSLLIATLFLIVVHEAGLRIFNFRVAIMATLGCAGQLIFFVQSTFMLPEVLIALFSLLSLYCYSIKSAWGTFISLTLLLFTKESGFALGAVLGVFSLAAIINRWTRNDQSIRLFIAICAGFGMIACFFVVQKTQRGWILFPEHTGYISLNWLEFKRKCLDSFDVMFNQQNRAFLYWALGTVMVVYGYAKRNFKLIGLVALFGFAAIFISDTMGYIPRRVMVPILLGALALIPLIIMKECDSLKKNWSPFVQTSSTFIVAYIVFSCINFYTERYMLCTTQLAILLAMFCIDTLMCQLKANSSLFIVPVIAIQVATSFAKSYPPGDTNKGAFDAMTVQKQTVDFLQHQQFQDSSMVVSSHLFKFLLTNPSCGFVDEHAPQFNKIATRFIGNENIVVVDKSSVDSSFHPNELKQNYTILKEFKQGNSRIEIWVRK